MTLHTLTSVGKGDASRHGMPHAGWGGWNYSYYHGTLYGPAGSALLNRSADTGDLTAEANTVIGQRCTVSNYDAGFVMPVTQAGLMSAGELTVACHFQPDPTGEIQIIGNIAAATFFIGLIVDQAGVQVAVYGGATTAFSWAELRAAGWTEGQLFVVTQWSATKRSLTIWGEGMAAPATKDPVVTGQTFEATNSVRLLCSELNTQAGRCRGFATHILKDLVDADEVARLIRQMRFEAFAFDSGVTAP